MKPHEWDLTEAFVLDPKTCKPRVFHPKTLQILGTLNAFYCRIHNKCILTVEHWEDVHGESVNLCELLTDKNEWGLGVVEKILNCKGKKRWG